MLSVVVDCRHITMKFYLLLLNTVFIAIAAEPSCENTSGEDVGEYGEYFEGDMILTEAQQRAMEDGKIPRDDNENNDVNEDNDDNEPDKNGLVDVTARWPNKTITYHIEERDFDKKEKKLIEEAIKDLASKSCVKFRKRQNKEEYAAVIQKRGYGCNSYVGYLKRVFKNYQVINLGPGCYVLGIIIHEILHALGFYHMQSTYDRDDYVKILYENIQRGYENNFEKYNNRTVTDFGVSYDYGSVMHYDEKAFSKNGKRTIIPKKEGVKIGQRKGLSKKDVMKLNKMYNCPNQDRDCDSDFSG